MGFPFHLATFEFSLITCNNEIEPFLIFFFQGERRLAVFFYEKLNKLLTQIIRPAVFAANSSTRKILKIDLKKGGKLITSDTLPLGSRTARAINKYTTTQALEVRKFKQNAQKCLIHLIEKLKELYIMSFTKPDSFF